MLFVVLVVLVNYNYGIPTLTSGLFYAGVRVLLQVAVVLVRRVLGRAEQRKQCQGQMETLERLRGVREQVQEDDDNFIAEVREKMTTADDEQSTSGFLDANCFKTYRFLGGK